MVIRVDLGAAVSVYARQTLKRLPRADAVLSLWAHVLDERCLAGIYAQHRGASYEGTLSFSVFVALVADALLQHGGSGRAAFVRARENGDSPVCTEAVYGKLRRIPVSLSIGLLEEATRRLRKIAPQNQSLIDVPKSLRDFTLVAVDGKAIKKCAKRLLVSRGQPGKLLGGRLLVAYLPTEGLAVSFAAAEDGETNDAKLMPALIPQAREAIEGPRLWVLDRQFCDLKQPALLAVDGDHFVIRYHSKTSFTPDPEHPERHSRDESGRTIVEQWGWLGSARSKNRRFVRRIRLERPDADDVVIITDLLDGDAFPASDLLALYRHRWKIEQAFQQVTEVFELRHLIGSTPRATIFQGAFCLLLYNLLQVLRQHIAGAQPDDVSARSLSLEMIFRDVTRQLIGLTELLSAAEIAALIPTRRSAAGLHNHLQSLLSEPIPKLWWKTGNTRPRAHPNPPRQSGAHTSVARLLSANKSAKKN